jgi:diguanylate cyclase (GGDEF)-like protein
MPISYAPGTKSQIDAGLQEAIRLSRGGEPLAALAMAFSLHQMATQAGDDRARADCSLQIAESCFQVGRIDDGLHHAAAAALLYQRWDDIAAEARARAIYAWLLIQRADSDPALEEALRALELGRRSADPVSLAFALNVTGVVYWLIKQPDKAIDFLQEAVEICEALPDDLLLGRCLTNLAGAEAELGLRAETRGDAAELRRRTQAAIAIEERALAICRGNGDAWSVSVILCNLAEHLCLIGDADAANALLDSHDPGQGSLGDRAMVHYRFTRGVVLAAQGRPEAAITEFQASLATEKDGDIEQAVMSHEHLAAAYERIGDYQAALAAYKKFHALQLRMAEEAVQRQARLAGLRAENDALRAQAAAARNLAEGLEQEKLSLMRDAESLSRTVLEDSLTLLPNRRRLEAAFFELLVSGEHYAVALLDVDHFKRINDNHSHMTGDQVLRQLGALLRQCCRQNDLPARYGGEEFAVLMRSGGNLDAGKLCERIRAAVAEFDWRGAFNIPPVTVSIGAATWSEADGPSGVLALADQRLYMAKAQGRNRTVCSQAEAALAAPQRRLIEIVTVQDQLPANPGGYS